MDGLASYVADPSTVSPTLMRIPAFVIIATARTQTQLSNLELSPLFHLIYTFKLYEEGGKAISHFIHICQGFINILHIIHFHDVCLRHGSWQEAMRVLGGPLLQVVCQMCFPDQALAHAVAAGPLLTCMLPA